MMMVLKWNNVEFFIECVKNCWDLDKYFGYDNLWDIYKNVS